MSTQLNPFAGKPVPAYMLADIPKLLAAYAERRPDPTVPAQRVAFGTSGHRGSALDCSFNEWHVVAISQAIADYRKTRGIDGPMFIGMDTHALSWPAFESALEVFAANGVETMIAPPGAYTPTPAVSRAILAYNRGREWGFADGIVITPSHNPPDNGGFKYNSPNGGPADTIVTDQIQARANILLEAGIKGVRRIPFAQARRLTTTCQFNFMETYVADLENVIDFDVVRSAGVHIGVDPLGGAGVHYWGRIAERYNIDLTVISEVVDPTFGFMTVDWDGKIRMDPSSRWAMQRLIDVKSSYDVAFACDTDHDRHGIVTPDAGLLPSNHYLVVAIDYLFRHRPQWKAEAAIGKTVVSSALIDRLTVALGRGLVEVPVGFKWFVDDLFSGTIGFAGEESAGASFSRMNGTVWTTDKDGITAALLSAEITARMGRNPGERYVELVHEHGEPVADRLEAPATARQKKRLATLGPAQLHITRLAGEKVEKIIDRAPSNDAAIGGIKVVTASGWFAARPSGTEDIYKIYAESFRGQDHLDDILSEAQSIVDTALAGP